jgi:hypothetical protein
MFRRIIPGCHRYLWYFCVRSPSVRDVTRTDWVRYGQVGSGRVMERRASNWFPVRLPRSVDSNITQLPRKGHSGNLFHPQHFSPPTYRPDHFIPCGPTRIVGFIWELNALPLWNICPAKQEIAPLLWNLKFHKKTTTGPCSEQGESSPHPISWRYVLILYPIYA